MKLNRRSFIGALFAAPLAKPLAAAAPTSPGLITKGTITTAKICDLAIHDAKILPYVPLRGTSLEAFGPIEPGKVFLMPPDRFYWVYAERPANL